MQVTVNDKKGPFLLELARTIRRALDVRPRHDLLPARGGPAHAQEDPIHGLQRYIEERGLASEQVLKQLDKAELYPPRFPPTPHPRRTHDAPRPTGASPPTYVFTQDRACHAYARYESARGSSGGPCHALRAHDMSLADVVREVWEEECGLTASVGQSEADFVVISCLRRLLDPCKRSVCVIGIVVPVVVVVVVG
ncbi:hypothetical protein B0H11DRAFT_2343063 [Mycena galericulata]|nr:hypothetical protein B0H11DRAFT_2343063 [Mycena galericulata]